jgi:gluconokinase
VKPAGLKSFQGNKKVGDGWFLGIDLGTGSCKSVVVSEAGQILGFGIGEYFSSKADQRWIDQNPQAVLEGMIRAVRAAIEQSGMNPLKCQALSIDSALHTLIAVDRKGEPLTGIYTWADVRGSQQAQGVRASPLAKELYQNSGCPPSNIYPLYKILWLREEQPEIFRQAEGFFTAKEYVFQKITGLRLQDYCLAAGSAIMNTHTLDWDPLALELIGINPGYLAPLADPQTKIRGINPELAKTLGIPADTLVVLGSSDAFNSTLGAGAVGPGQATCMVGTSGAFRTLVAQPILDENARTWCYAVDRQHWLIGGAINNGGLSLSWLRDLINSAALGGDHMSFEKLVDLAGASPAGSGGLVCLPFFTGERSPNWNGDARAMFFGLTLQHDIRHVSRSLLEGVAYRLRSISEILSDLTGDIQEIHASGGFAHSGLWPQIISSVIGRDLLTPEWPETSSLGAALWAMLGAGAFSSLEDAAGGVTIARRIQPIPADMALYDRLYRVYQELYRQVERSFTEIASLQREVSD